MPVEVYEQMRGLSFSSYFFGFIPTFKIIPKDDMPLYFDQKDERLKDIDLESGSTFVNAFMLIILLIVILGK